MQKPVFGGTFNVVLGCILHHHLVPKVERYRQLNEICKICETSFDSSIVDDLCPNPHMLLTCMQSMTKEGMERVFWSDLHKRVMVRLHDQTYPIDPADISTLLASAGTNKKSRGVEGTIQAGNIYQRDQQIAIREKYEILLKAFKEKVCDYHICMINHFVK